MLSRPKTLSSTATVGDVRKFFENPHVMTALLVEGDDFRGAIDRGSLPDEADTDADALDYVASATPTIAPDASVEDALEALHGLESRRLVVLDAEGDRLLGLVCLNTSGTHFCKDP